MRGARRTLGVFACHLTIVLIHSLLLAMNEAQPACAHTPRLGDVMHPPILLSTGATSTASRGMFWVAAPLRGLRQGLDSVVHPDTILKALTYGVIATLFVHPDRFLLLRRLLLLHGVLSLTRGILISSTILPSPHSGCRDRVVDPSLARAGERALALTLKIMEIPPHLLGLRFGYDLTCCDLIISGHTCVLSADILLLLSAWRGKYWPHVLAGATAIVALMFAHPDRHYSIDVMITLYLASSLAFIYHTLASSLRSCLRSNALYAQQNTSVCTCACPSLHSCLAWLEQPDVFPDHPTRIHLSSIAHRVGRSLGLSA